MLAKLPKITLFSTQHLHCVRFILFINKNVQFEQFLAHIHQHMSKVKVEVISHLFSNFPRISSTELLGDLLKSKPKETDGVESVIVVDGVPQIGANRIEKLKIVINKIFAKFGNIVNEFYPVNEKGETKGYIFIEYSSPQHAAEAVKLTNNFKLDKQHTFQVNLFTDFSKYSEIPEEWEAPTPEQYEGQPDLHYYQLEPDAYDQFAVVLGQDVQFWQNTQPDPTLMEERQVKQYQNINYPVLTLFLPRTWL